MGKRGTIAFEKLLEFQKEKITSNYEDKIGLKGTLEDKNDEVDGGSDSMDEEEHLQKQVEDIPFEVLQRLRSEGGPKFQPHPPLQSNLKRANKNRPMEMSSKKPVGRYREVIQAPKLEHRDPRFESLCGSFDQNRFAKAYSFLYNEELPAEFKRLQKLSRSQRDESEAEKAQEDMKWIDRQLKSEEERRKWASKVSEQKKIEKEAIKQGKRPFYAKKSEIRKQVLIEKYTQLKASGKLEAYMAKRRKKNAAKDHRYVPYRRPVH